MQLFPAILTESTFEIQDQLALLDPIGDKIATVQVDIVDGEFADNLTISPIDLIGTDFGSLQVDFHLMVNDPENFVYECRQVDNVRTVIAQVERMHSQASFIQEVKEYSMNPGLSLDLYTPVEAIDKSSWEEISVLQIMGIKAGFQGQDFKGKMVLDKIKEVAALKKKLDLPALEIIVDGGVKPANVEAIEQAGATGVSVGSALWQSKDIEKTVAELI